MTVPPTGLPWPVPVSPGGLVGLDDVMAASDRLDGLVVRTPLVECTQLSDLVGHPVKLKSESLQRAGSFKVRGALNFVLSLPAEAAGRGVITYSSGNHGQAVALAARLGGRSAVVVLPTTASQVKVDGCIRWGARLVFEGITSEQRRQRAEVIAREQDLTVVPPFDHPWIIAGQGTVGLEIHQDWPEVETVLFPIGGGGLASGVSAALRRLCPGVRLLGVEPAGAASMRAALDAGRPVTLPNSESVADGLLPNRVGELTHRHVSALADDVVTVEEGSIREAARFLVLNSRLVVEFSGATALAALLSNAVPSPGRTVAIVSGGNIDPEILVDLVGES